MRWLVDRQEPAPEVKVGDKRTVVRFAWFPILVDTDDTIPMRVWLERYYEQQVYSLVDVSDGYGSWEEYRWRREGRWSFDPFIAEAMRQACVSGAAPQGDPK